VTRFLLDVNVLAALIDPAHVQHDRAHDWFAAQGRKAWATCPLTENGVVRVVGHARYPNCAGTPAAVAELVAILRGLGGHEFWSDDISLLECQHIDTTRLLDSGQVNDTYLLALAVAHGGRLATFDRHLVTNAVVNGTKALHLLA
jgi:toxin-antitoxin system PIN domain toxin